MGGLLRISLFLKRNGARCQFFKMFNEIDWFRSLSQILYFGANAPDTKNVKEALV